MMGLLRKMQRFITCRSRVLAPVLLLVLTVYVLLGPGDFGILRRQDSEEAATDSVGDSMSLPTIRPLIPKEDKSQKQPAVENVHVPQKVTKAYLFTYMRSGSTLLGKTLNLVPQSMYWYEVMDSFYMAQYGLRMWHQEQVVRNNPDGSNRVPTKSEDGALSTYLDKLFNCQLEDLPRELFCHPAHRPMFSRAAGPFFKCYSQAKGLRCVDCEVGNPLNDTCGEFLADSLQHGCPSKLAKARQCASLDQAETCMPDPKDRPLLGHQRCIYAQEPTMLKCFPLLKEACQTAPLQFTKDHRVSMRSMDALLELIPGLKVVHYVRHPGAIAVSRERLNYTWPGGNKDLVLEAQMICSNMLDDIKVLKDLKRRHPGAFISLRYEDLVEEPAKVIKKLFNHLDYPLPDSIIPTIEKSLHDESANSWVFGTSRRNATATALAWRESVSQPLILGMKEHCAEVYEELGYT